jgi:GlpG protein
MRQVGSLPDQRDAERFAAFLVTQGIDAHAEQDMREWAIWVRDENCIEQARESFELFKIDPNDSRYKGAERDAEAIRREEAQRRISAQKNMIEMRGRWRQPMARRAPLTFTMVVLSVVVTLVGNFGQADQGIGGTINRQLSFCRKVDFITSDQNPLASLGKGELWRAVTPIFIHLDWRHIVFNMIMFFQFGALVESLRGTVRLAVIVICVAVISNLAQAVAPPDLPLGFGGTPFFGGMSGVVYGLFGYVLMKSWYTSEPGFALSQLTKIILIGWLFLCLTPAIPNVANVAHFVGLVSGQTLAYLPILWKR